MFRFPSASIKRVIVLVSIAFIVLGLFLDPIARAQSTSGTLAGQVFDAQGKPLSGVKVTIVNETSGNAFATVTDGSGTYRRPFLTPGNYKITASLANYTDVTITTRVPLNQTTEIQPPAITLRPIATAQTTTPTPTTPTPTTPTPTPISQPAGQGGLQESGSASLVNKTDAARGGNFTEAQLESLPLGGGATMRSFDELALLVPGVLPPPYTPGVRGPGVGFGIGTAGQFSVNGLRARSNNFTVDGSDNNDPDVGVRRQGFVTLVPQSIESVQEFQISTLLWNAELGRNFGSQVNAVSKSGSAAIHGQAYGFFTHNSLNARNAFDFLGGDSDGEDPFTRLQAGAVIGGPIGKNNRTQWFASYEYLHISSSVEQHFASPSLAQRRFLGAPAFAITDTGVPELEIADLIFITTSGATPAGRNIFSFYPVPTNPVGPYGENNFTEILPSDGEGSVASFKITHQLTPNDTLNARYNFTDDNRVLPSVNQAIRSTVIADSRTQNLSFILDSAMKTNLFNQARFSFGRTRLDFPEYPGSPFVFRERPENAVTSIAFPFPDGSQEIVNFDTLTGPIGEIIIQPFSPVGVDVFTFPQARVNNTFQVADSISWTKLNHSLKFGVDVRRYQLNSRQERNYRPLVNINNGLFQEFAFSGNDLVSVGDPQLLAATDVGNLGLASNIFQSVTIGPSDSTIGLRFAEYNFFINDNWRIRPNLTFDYGLRYEYNTVPNEVNNRIEDALALQTLPTPGNSLFNTDEDLAAFNDTVNAYRRVLGDRTGIYEPDRNNVGPHFGFAWDPKSDGRTSIRAGYGIYYDTILGAVVSQSRNIFPNEIPLTIDVISFFNDIFSLTNLSSISLVNTDGQGNVRAVAPLIQPGTLNQLGVTGADVVPLLGFLFRNSRRVFPDGSTTTRSGLAFTLPEKDLRTPYVQQWHLTLERQLMIDYVVSAAYVGTRGTKLTRLTTPNLGPNLTLFPEILFDEQTGIPVVITRRSQFRQPRPEFNLGAYQIFENSASSTYHALQLEARKRYSNGYTFTLAYTWSHALDDVSDVFPISGAPVIAQDSFNLKAEHGSANFDVRHRFAASVVWDLPFYRNSTSDVADWLGGWQLASIFQAHTGQPFTLNVAFDSNLDGNLSDRPTTTDGLIFFDGHGSQRVGLAPGASLIDFLPSTERLANSLVRPSGAVGRNTLRGDGFINLDMALAKNFRFSESQALEFRTEVFNVLNRTNYGLPVRTIGAPGFGSSTDTVNPARIIQFAFKYSF